MRTRAAADINCGNWCLSIEDTYRPVCLHLSSAKTIGGFQIGPNSRLCNTRPLAITFLQFRDWLGDMTTGIGVDKDIVLSTFAKTIDNRVVWRLLIIFSHGNSWILCSKPVSGLSWTKVTYNIADKRGKNSSCKMPSKESSQINDITYIVWDPGTSLEEWRIQRRLETRQDLHLQHDTRMESCKSSSIHFHF